MDAQEGKSNTARDSSKSICCWEGTVCHRLAKQTVPERRTKRQTASFHGKNPESVSSGVAKLFTSNSNNTKTTLSSCKA
eukprot:10585413-Karenia_brevis.AAC.1